ncbi:MAG: DotI/IcmL family type IV secretion protein [Legionella sp.]|nr:DotI/IcmL family type IV secretion protein [Legionella sp.]
MNTKRLSPLFLFFILLFPTINYADDAGVISWTKQTLLNTLTIDYKNMKTELDKSKANYTPAAWGAFKSFLGDKVATIQDNQLTLHPTAPSSGTIVDAGNVDNVTYWRINQPIDIPELNMSVTFTVVVIKASNPPYLIQSVNMTQVQY